MRRDVFSRRKILSGARDRYTIISALNLAVSLTDLQEIAEAKQILREFIPASKKALGTEHDLTLILRASYGRALYKDDGASRGDLAEAVAVLDDIVRRSRRVYGTQHPETLDNVAYLRNAREALARANE